MITLLERYGDEVKPRAVSSNVVENFFSLARSKKPVFTVAEWAGMYQNTCLVQNQRQTGKQATGYSLPAKKAENHMYRNLLFTEMMVIAEIISIYFNVAVFSLN